LLLRFVSDECHSIPEENMKAFYMSLSPAPRPNVARRRTLAQKFEFILKGRLHHNADTANLSRGRIYAGHDRDAIPGQN
jgi:hypothetical protein